MGITDSLTRKIVGVYDDDSLSGRARRRRWLALRGAFPGIETMTVLDLGGDIRAWRGAPITPERLVLWNTYPQEVDEPWATAAVVDVCEEPDLPDVDLVYSNSVLGHVGGHWRRTRFAETVRAAPRYWIQTPNRYFPVEPSFMFPLLQHLPRKLQREAIARYPIGNFGDLTDRREVMKALLGIELLSRSELEFYFPEAEIYTERILGLAKSFVAVRG